MAVTSTHHAEQVSQAGSARSVRAFHHLLANNLIANITNFTVWFAVTFWVFLETRSVFATGMIAGITSCSRPAWPSGSGAWSTIIGRRM